MKYIMTELNVKIDKDTVIYEKKIREHFLGVRYKEIGQ